MTDKLQMQSGNKMSCRTLKQLSKQARLGWELAAAIDNALSKWTQITFYRDGDEHYKARELLAVSKKAGGTREFKDIDAAVARDREQSTGENQPVEPDDTADLPILR